MLIFKTEHEAFQYLYDLVEQGLLPYDHGYGVCSYTEGWSVAKNGSRMLLALSEDGKTLDRAVVYKVIREGRVFFYCPVFLHAMEDIN